MPALAATSTATVDGTGVYLRRIRVTPLLDKAQEVMLAKRVEAGLYAQALLGEGRTTADATADELAQIARDGRQARADFIQANLRLVVAMARRYQHRGVTLDDLIQEGNEGLAKAVDHFDFTREVKFSSYATWWIRQALLSSLGTARTVRIPEEHEQALRKICAVGAELFNELGRPPTTQEIADRVQIPPDKIDSLLQYDNAVVSLDSPIAGETSAVGTLGDVISDQGAADQLAGVEADADTSALRRLLRARITALTDNEARALNLRYGLTDGRPKQLNEVAARMGLSRERVRQLESGGIQRLRHLDCAQPLLRTYLQPDVA